MKLPIIATAIVFIFTAEGAMAACSSPATQVEDNTNPSLATLLTNNTVCAIRGGDRWQEQHRTGGSLWDYKRGPGDKVDPTKQVGIWSVSGTGANTVVNYSYGSGGTYSYSVWNNGGGSYSFCNGSALEMDFTVTTGTVTGCP